MRITVDQNRCIGSGQCVMVADEVFGQRMEDGAVVLLGACPPAEQADDIREAADACPTRAISLDESPGEP